MVGTEMKRVRRVVHVTVVLWRGRVSLVVDRAVLKLPLTVLAAAASDVGRHSPKALTISGTPC